MMTSMNKKMAAVVLAVTVAMSLSACSNWSIIGHQVGK